MLITYRKVHKNMLRLDISNIVRAVATQPVDNNMILYKFAKASFHPLELHEDDEIYNQVCLFLLSSLL